MTIGAGTGCDFGVQHILRGRQFAFGRGFHDEIENSALMIVDAL